MINNFWLSPHTTNLDGEIASNNHSFRWTYFEVMATSLGRSNPWWEHNKHQHFGQLLLTRLELSNRTTHKRQLVGTQSSNVRSALLVESIPKLAWLRAFETGSRTMITEVGACMSVSEMWYKYNLKGLRALAKTTWCPIGRGAQTLKIAKWS